MSAPIERIDNSATAALFIVGMLIDRLTDRDGEADELSLLTTLEALLQRIEELVAEAQL